MENMDGIEFLGEEDLQQMSFAEIAFYLQTINQVKDFYDSVENDSDE